MLNNHVGESDDRSVRAEKVSQQAEENQGSAIQKKSRKSGRREEKVSR